MRRTFSGRVGRSVACALVICATCWFASPTALPASAALAPASIQAPARVPQYPPLDVHPATAQRRIVALPPSDDPLLGSLWGLERIAAPTAWATTTGSDAIVVGVVDTGIDHTHPDLADNIWSAPAGWDVLGCGPGTHGYRSIGGATGCAPGDTADDNGHGTHIAGTIGARGNNGIGVAGVNWRVKLMSLKALNANGATTVADVVAVLEYALAAKQAGVNLRVLNLGFSSDTRSAELHAVLAQLDAAGVLVVAGAGDTGASNDLTPSYPANTGAFPDFLPNVIAVAGTDASDVNQFNSGVQSVHLSAPGIDIWSTAPGADYDIDRGTATAAAHVSGAAALLLAAPGLGDLGVAELKARLMYCGDALVGPQHTISGRRLNVAQALAGCALPTLAVTATVTLAGSGTVAVTPSGGTFAPGDTVSLSATAQPGYRFAGWRTATDGDLGASNPLTLPLFQSYAIKAVFVREEYRLTLTATAGGSATVTPGGEIFFAGTAVQIAAVPDAGYRFDGWTLDGVPAGATTPLMLTMDGNRTLHAAFVSLSAPPFTLGLSASPGGRVEASAAGPHAAGARVEIAATADPGYVFTGWTIDGSPGGDTTPLTLTMAAHRTAHAAFAPAHALRLSWTQGGSARVTASTWERGSPYPAGTVATLTATTNSDYIFTGWTVDGAFAGWANPLTLTLASERTVVANFARRRHFTDLPPGPPPYESISQLASRLIIVGYKNGSFGPNDTTQRAQMAALIARAMGWDQEDHRTPFTDPGGVDPNLWRNVGTLAHYGVARGYGDGRFGTFDKVTRVQVISFIARGMVARGLWVAETINDPTLYPNIPLASGHRLDLLTFYRNAGAIPGTAALQPWADWGLPATRGWFAEALWQAIDSYYRVDRLP